VVSINVKEGFEMSVYKFIEIVGTSHKSWEEAAQNAIKSTAATLRDIRIAEVEQMDMAIDDGETPVFRTKIKVSFRVERIEEGLFYTNPGAWLVEQEHPSMDG
jgi:flavin-binding protein dodecin